MGKWSSPAWPIMVWIIEALMSELNRTKALAKWGNIVVKTFEILDVSSNDFLLAYTLKHCGSKIGFQGSKKMFLDLFRNIFGFPALIFVLELETLFLSFPTWEAMLPSCLDFSVYTLLYTLICTTCECSTQNVSLFSHVWKSLQGNHVSAIPFIHSKSQLLLNVEADLTLQSKPCQWNQGYC